jgi:hypothetical protein
MKLKTILFSIACIFSFNSCQKAGFGGNASIAVFVYENQKLAQNITVYLKFNTNKEPNELSDYDLVKNCDTSGHYLGHTHFSNLKAGKYFLLAKINDASKKENKKGKSILINSENKNTETDIRIDL